MEYLVLKEMKYQAMKSHGGSLNAYWQVREASVRTMPSLAPYRRQRVILNVQEQLQRVHLSFQLSSA